MSAFVQLLSILFSYLSAAIIASLPLSHTLCYRQAVDSSLPIAETLRLLMAFPSCSLCAVLVPRTSDRRVLRSPATCRHPCSVYCLSLRFSCFQAALIHCLCRTLKVKRGNSDHVVSLSSRCGTFQRIQRCVARVVAAPTCDSP